MPNLSSMCSAFYLIIICVFCLSLCHSLAFFWSCDACVQSDRCLDIPWNWIRRSYWTYCNWIACLSSHWESSEFYLMSHLLYIPIYCIYCTCVWYLSEICTFSSLILLIEFLWSCLSMLIYFFRFILHMKFYWRFVWPRTELDNLHSFAFRSSSFSWRSKAFLMTKSISSYRWRNIEEALFELNTMLKLSGKEIIIKKTFLLYLLYQRKREI